ncbi:MAG: DUF2442 domain-containing protein [Microcystis panniformis]
MELNCDGTGLHWETLDEDLSIIGILEGRLGTYMLNAEKNRLY